MKKIFLFMFLIILINGCINNQNINSKLPVCGDNICKESEKYYCLDCNLSCKSEICNSKINLICDNCTETQKKLLPTLFENQIIIYDCLSNYYNYNPEILVYHTISYSYITINACTEKEGCYISGGGFAERGGIKQSFIPGLREYDKKDITKKENVGFEVHELAHAFTYYGLGFVPSWFSEGVSIYTESRIFCRSNQVLSNIMDSFLPLYEKLKKNNLTSNEIMPNDEYYQTKYSNHMIGSLYFLALEQDYNCNKKCISKILYSLHQYRENCTGICFENARNSIPQLINISLNNKDLRVPIITNKIIKQKSEEITNQNLTRLFDLLEINYSD